MIFLQSLEEPENNCNSWSQKYFVHPVGFHRYFIKNVDGNTFEGLNELEVEEFDPPSEVSTVN